MKLQRGEMIITDKSKVKDRKDLAEYRALKKREERESNEWLKGRYDVLRKWE